MKKPDSLRAWLEACIPGLKKNPEQLLVFIEGGAVRATGAETPGPVTGLPILSFRYGYKLSLIFAAYAGDPDSITVPLLAWIARNEPTLLGPGRDQKPAFVFDADRVANDATHIAIDVELEEFVRIVRRDDGGFDLQHIDEPDWTEAAALPPTQIYLNGEVIAEYPG